MPNTSSYHWWIYVESNLDSSADQYFFHLMEPVGKIGNMEGTFISRSGSNSSAFCMW